MTRILWGMIAFLAASGWESSAQASCGDWLAHPAAPQAEPATPDSRPGTVPTSPVCHGPGCSRQRQRENPTPAAPLTLTRTDLQWVEWLAFVIPPEPPAGRAALIDAHAAAVFQPRRERPPRG